MLRQPRTAAPPNFMGGNEESRARPPKDETPEKRRERLLAQRRCMEAIWRPKIPEIHKVDYENFKNRYSEEKPDYAIEALIGSSNLSSQIRDEERRRRETRISTQQHLPMLAAYELMEALAEKNTPPRGYSKENRTIDVGMSGSMNETYIHRIRIQSQPILGYLTKIMGENENPVHRSWPRTFFRPFRPLVYFHPEMKKTLSNLEDKWKSLEAHEDKQKAQSEADKDIGVDPHSAPQHEESDAESESNKSLASVSSREENTSRMMDKVMDSTEALRDMRCYVDFVDKEIMPHFNFLQGNEPRRIAFDDLWCLFHVGELVYAPITGNGTDGHYQELWRLYRISSPEPEPDRFPRHMFWGVRETRPNITRFDVFCYHIGHDGSSYGAVRRKFRIESYSGERDIKSLEVYPLRLAENRNQLLDTLQQQGKKFQGTFEERHQAYNNWSLTMQMTSSETHRNIQRLATRMADILDVDESLKVDYMQDDNKIASEYIESHVIVDLEEAFKANPRWRPRFHRPTIYKSDPNMIEQDWPIQVWSGKSPRKFVLSIPEVVQIVDGVELRQRQDNLLNTDAFLRHRAEGATRWDRLDQLSEKLGEEDLVLLPKRSFAYTLRERKFVVIDVNYLKPIIKEEGVFERLKILKDYKDIVRGLVSSHFQKKELERLFAGKPFEILGQDLIRGKGKGLVILLHGVPGVGKTATAEAVAMESNKPLFTITCGDLGLVASEVESSLTNILRLAQKWDCVLLLDEADVFLSQRSRFDMKRNSLVSVFLRVLEYYNGLLFLTTNRVGTIDEAFKSRIHMSLYYPPLDRIQTKVIFGLNLKKLREIEHQRSLMTGKPELVINETEIFNFADRHYDTNQDSGGRWNGRQIRNAFQIASGLAHYHFAQGVDRAQKEGTEPPSVPVLGSTLFEKVQLATQNFDKYMRETKGVDDAEGAYRLGDRADHFRTIRPPPSPAYVPSTSQANFNMTGAFGIPPTASGPHTSYGDPYARPGQVYTPSYAAGGGQGFHQTPPSNTAQYPPGNVGHQNSSHPELYRNTTSSQSGNMASRGDIGAPSQRPWNTQTPNQSQQTQSGVIGQEHLSPLSAASSRSPGYGTASTSFQAPTVTEEEDLYD
ncbi:Putative cell division cycle ATPase [Cytospora mali]|uniref:Cell division cycle ATPase n=1 Tax=Cytospora mali TaxID=578113 RepID=A0A194V022_CYTMA|nr:Putative cell division cycle ATPase [Valsa mali var. pyri (nom. inval.)]